MRTKEELLREIRQNINERPKEIRPMLDRHYCFFEVLIDIRDIFEKYRETRDSFLKHVSGTD